MRRTATTVTLVAWLAMSTTGCPDPSLVPCGDLLCPHGATCVAGELCATQDQLAACVGIADGNTCPIGGGVGRCDRGVCVAAGCGNGVVDPAESCDDGNATSGDGCRADCAKIEMCGDAIVDTGEGCDDANANASDGCDACAPTTWRSTAAIGGAISAVSVGLVTPRGVAVDRHGNVYIADSEAERIRRVDVSGVITVVAGDGTAGHAGDDGPATAARLRHPTDVAVDGLGNLYIADEGNHRIRRVDAAGTITTIAGTGAPGFGGDGGPATGATLRLPNAVTVDGLGNLWVSDGVNNRIRRIDVAGTITTIAGNGVAAYGGDGGLALEASIRPWDVAVDADGGVYFADGESHRVRRVDPNGIVRTVAGTGIQGTTRDGWPAIDNPLNFPTSVGLDATGRLLIGQAAGVVRVEGGGTITRIAGTPDAGFSGDGGPATVARLTTVGGVAADASGALYISDVSNRRLRRVDAGGTITTVAGDGSRGTEAEGALATGALLTGPQAIALDGTGALFIAEPTQHRVRRVDPNGVITTFAGTSVRGFAGDGGPAAAAQLDFPNGVAVGRDGEVYISDLGNSRIRMVDASGTITTVAGNGTPGAAGDGGPALQAQLFGPSGLAVDPVGRILVADTYNHKIRRIDSDGRISTVVGTGTEGYSGDGAAATDARLSQPNSVAVGADGTLYVLDTRNAAIRRVTTSGTITTIAGRGGVEGEDIPATDASLADPNGVAVDAAGTVYVTESAADRVREIVGGRISTTAGAAGRRGDDGDGGPALAATLSAPSGIAVDPAGRVWFVDALNHRVKRIGDDGIVTTVAGRIDPEGTGPVARGRLADARALAVTPALTVVAGGTHGVVEAVVGGSISVVAGRYPQPTPIADRARFRGSGFGTVSGVAYDSAGGLLYITESTSHRLHVIHTVEPSDPATWTITAMNAGTPGHLDGPLATARFRDPQGLYLDTIRRMLYVADTGNHVIRVIALAEPGQPVTTIAGTPATRGVFGDGGPATAAQLYAPRALTRCGNGDLLIADTGNHRVRRIAAATGVISTVLGDGVPASSGEGAPATSFPVHAPLGLACDAAGNVFVSSTTTVRLLPADHDGIVDGTGSVLTIYGAPLRARFPESVTSCLTGLAVIDEQTVRVADACSGLLVELRRERQ